MTLTLVLGVIAIGLAHGITPDHGWPLAATYALRQSRRYLAGLVAGIIIGLGHLLSSIALVLLFLWAREQWELGELEWLKIAAGLLLIALGIREYFHTRAHNRDPHGHAHDHAGHDPHGHGNPFTRWMGRLGARLNPPGERGLKGLVVAAILLGFAHEEPIQILGICAGTEHCLALMVIYSLAVIVAILIPTLALIAGYGYFRERIERYLPHLGYLTAAILVAMGVAFVTGLL